MILKATIDSDILKKTVDAITAVVENGPIGITEDGITMKVLDSSSVAMLSLKMNKDTFGEYSLKSSEVEVNIDFTKLRGFLEKMEKGNIELNIDDKKLYLKIHTFDYATSLLALSLSHTSKVPNITFPTQVILKTEDFIRVIRGAEKVSKYIMFSISNEVFSVMAKNELEKLEWNLNREQVIDMVPGIANSTYNLSYLISMLRGVKHSGKVTLNLGIDTPLRLDFQLADIVGAVDISYLVAPRIESSYYALKKVTS